MRSKPPGWRGFFPISGGAGLTPQKNRPPTGGRLGFKRLLLRLEAPARHAGVEHGHGYDIGRVGVWGPKRGKKGKGRIKVTLGMIVALKNRRYNLPQTPAKFEPNH